MVVKHYAFGRVRSYIRTVGFIVANELASPGFTNLRMRIHEGRPTRAWLPEKPPLIYSYIVNPQLTKVFLRQGLLRIRPKRPVRLCQDHEQRHIARGLGKMLERFDSWELAWQSGRLPNGNGTGDAAGPAHYILGPSGAVAAGDPSAEIPGGANAMAQGFPPPDLIYDMVGTYGFGLDENLLDPSMASFEFLAQ